MAHAQKPDFVFRRNGRVHLNRQGRQFSRLLAAEMCTSAVVMLDTPCSEVVWRVLATHSIHQFPLHFLSRASPCAITFQTHSNTLKHAVFGTFGFRRRVRKITANEYQLSYVLSLCCSTTRKEQFDSHCTDFHKNSCPRILGNICRENSDFTNFWLVQRYCTWRQVR
jgi:hypothetical protein